MGSIVIVSWGFPADDGTSPATQDGSTTDAETSRRRMARSLRGPSLGPADRARTSRRLGLRQNGPATGADPSQAAPVPVQSPGLRHRRPATGTSVAGRCGGVRTRAGTVAAMAKVRVVTMLDTSPDAVWADVADISSHVEWMADATAIRFVSAQTSGVGTTFECDTKVGPFKLTDVMEITEWAPGKVMGVRHTGLVTGTGRFTLKKATGGRTQFQWKEKLVFPWWMGGPVGAFVSKPVLARIWRGNLTRLATRFSR